MRLIDADRLKEKVLKWLPSDPCGIEEKEHPIETDIVVSLMMEIEEAPTVNEWIPVSTLLPIREDYYLVTWEDEDGRCTLCDYFRPQYGFRDCVKAWMPLPKPWKDGEEE